MAPSQAAVIDDQVWVSLLDEIVIGRQAGLALELPFSTVSLRHARLFRGDGVLEIEDLGSHNGTFLSGHRLDAHRAYPIAFGETIRIANVDVIVEADDTVSQASASAGTADLARRLVHGIFELSRPADFVRIEVLGGASAGQSLALIPRGRSWTIGRGEACDFVLRDEDVSREHAQVEHTEAGIVVRDLQSKNGVFIGEQRLIGARTIHDGETLRMGETELRLVDPEERYLRQMETPDAVALPGAVPLAAELMPSSGQSASDPSVGPPHPGRFAALATAAAVSALLLVLAVLLSLALGGCPPG